MDSVDLCGFLWVSVKSNRQGARAFGWGRRRNHRHSTSAVMGRMSPRCSPDRLIRRENAVTHTSPEHARLVDRSNLPLNIYERLRYSLKKIRVGVSGWWLNNS